MNGPSYGDRDPVAAPATPLAESALAIVRTSGGTSPQGEGGQSAIELLSRAFSRPRKLLSAPPDSLVHGWIIDPESAEKIDEVMVSVYRAPRSYTGEDGADISCHGGIAVVRAVMAALKKAGFRGALPGEFTFRAFMNGKLDLTRAESVMELVASKTSKGREQAVRRLAGVLQEEVSAIKALLVQVLAGAEIYLDYSEDEFFGTGSSDEEAGRLPDRQLAEEAASRLRALADLWRRERIYAEGALAVIAGRPNAGKSSLFNYLLREDRSIVTDIPGTTRDWIEALISVDGIPLRLADTAGLRNFNPKSSGSGGTDLKAADEAERIGIQRSLELLDKADLILYVIDGAEGITGTDREFLLKREEAAPAQPILVLWNKADLAPPPNEGGLPLRNEFQQDTSQRNLFRRDISRRDTSQQNTSRQILAVSAKTGEGISGLLRSIAGLLEEPSSGKMSSAEQDAAGPGTVRQKELIDAALASVEEALALAGGEEPLDIIAPLLRSSINSLGEITGEVSSADILETMFSRFCVGK